LCESGFGVFVAPWHESRFLCYQARLRLDMSPFASLYQLADQIRRSARLLRSTGLREGFRALRTFPLVAPYTMVGRKRLEGLYRLTRQVIRDDVPGDFVECGTCNGGTAAVIAAAGLRGNDRILWLFDSFEGLPPAGVKDGARAAEFMGKCLGQVETVMEVLERVNAPPERVKIVPGWFDRTFPTAETGTVALPHCDADWYESVALTLDRFYDSVTPGGIIVFDDYGFWQGCKSAVDEFLAGLDQPPKLSVIDTRGVYLRKPW
jgi:O-methyltransferase